jgi:hypothetical protein
MPDRKGMLWDLMLYIPTVVALASISATLWYDSERNASYLFFFLTCFFAIAGFNRVFKTRLMLLPSSVVSLSIADRGLSLLQKDGTEISLMKSFKYFPDYAGRSFGVSGMDGSGRQLQFVFHKGQFPSPEKFASAQEAFKRQAATCAQQK